MECNVLITGWGAPGTWGTVYSLKNNDQGWKFHLHGCDMNENVAMKDECEEFFRVPTPEDRYYLTIIDTFCKSSHIDLIIPQTTREIEVLNDIKGIPVLCSPFESIQVANNKLNVYLKAHELKIPAPKTYVLNMESEFYLVLKNAGIPAVIKPLNSSGSRGFRVITNDWPSYDDIFESKEQTNIGHNDLYQVFKNDFKGPFLMQEYLPGIEWTVDCFRDPISSRMFSVPRKRTVVKNGISWACEVDMNKIELMNYCSDLANELNLFYCFGFQFKEDAGGTPKLLECNPRIQGTMVASTMAGFNMIFEAARIAITGNRFKKDFPDVKNISCVRYSCLQRI